MIKFNLINKSYSFDFDTNLLIKSILDETISVLNINTDHVVSYIIIDNNEIHKINNTYRHIDRPTDVISFANIDSYSDDTIPYELGDIYISYEKVLSQAIEYKHSIKRELAFLVTHGILHLFGYDHMVKSEEEVMFNLQDKILNNLNILR